MTLLQADFLSSQNIQGLKPNEDYFVCDENIQLFIVCDGISRTVKKGEQYPEPSPSAMAARIVASSIQDYLNQELRNNNKDLSKLLHLSVIEANRDLARFNAQTFEKFDFAENDRAGTCLALVLINDLKAYWIAIGDSIIAQVRDSELKEISKNQSLEVEAYYPNPDEETLKLLRTFRNNKDAKYSYAALTGEEVAINFLQQGEFSIEKGDIIFIYSDGLQSFFDRFRAGQEHLSLTEIKEIATKNCIELKQKLDDQTIIKLEF